MQCIGVGTTSQCSMATPPAKILKMSDTGMAQQDEQVEVAAAGGGMYNFFAFIGDPLITC